MPIPGVTMHCMPIYHRNPIRQLANVFTVRRQIRKIRPDVVHLFGLFSLSSLGSMLIAIGLRPIISVMGSDIVPGSGIETRQDKFIKRFLLARASMIVSPTRYLALETAKYTGRPLKMKLIASGVDLDIFRPADVPHKGGEIRIGFAKRFTSASGPDVLLNAFALARKRTDRDIVLLMAGKGPLEDSLHKQAKELALSDSIHWLGWIETQQKLRDFFHSLDIFAQPSRRESFGVSAAQAAACGLPVIASRYGGIPEVVIDRKTGFLVAPENEQELAEAMLLLIHDAGLRLSMGTEGRKWIERNFEWKTCVAKMIGIYGQCCGINQEAQTNNQAELEPFG